MTTFQHPASSTASSFEMDGLSNVTPAVGLFSNVTSTSPPLPVCSMMSLDTNVTKSNDSATGASIVSPIVMFLAGVVGNVLALVVLHRSKKETRSMKFYTLVAALTWNDLIGILLTSPIPMATYINHRQMPAVDKLCRFHGFVMVCFGLSTPLIVCSMAVERSLALKCPYFYFKYCNPGSARILVGVLWAFVLLFGALPLFGLGSYSLQYPCTWCFLDFRSGKPLDMTYAYAYAVLNLVVVVVMIFCNAVVMTTLCHVRQTRRKLSISASQNNSTTLLNNCAAVGDATGANMTADEKTWRTVMMAQQQQPNTPLQAQAPCVRRRNQRDVELQMIWLLCAITTIFSVCWVPLMAYILFSLQSEENHAPVFGLVAVRLASLNQTINPWIYVILRKSLLARIRRFCRSRPQCCPDSGPDHRLPRRAVPPPYLYAAGQGQGRRQGYVHVRQQLCPSSQFVGQKQQNGSLSRSDRDRKGSRGSGSSRSNKRARAPAGGGGWGDSYASDSWTSGDRFRGGGGGSSGLCSVCRMRLVRAVEDGDIRDFRSLTSSSGSPPPPTSGCASQRCGAASSCGGGGGGGGIGSGEPCGSRFAAPLTSSSSSTSGRGGGSSVGIRRDRQSLSGDAGNDRVSSAASASRSSGNVVAACSTHGDEEEEEDHQSDDDPSVGMLQDSHSPRRRDSSEARTRSVRPHAEPSDDVYVDLFRQLPVIASAASSLPPRGDGEATSKDKARGVAASNNNAASCRSEVERFFLEAAEEIAAKGENDKTAVSSNINTVSIISEGDDHGYGSKVSTDSSRNSSPENRRGVASSEREQQPTGFSATTTAVAGSLHDAHPLPPPHHHRHHHQQQHDSATVLAKPDRHRQRSAEDSSELTDLSYKSEACARLNAKAKSSSGGSTSSSGGGLKTDRKSSSSLRCSTSDWNHRPPPPAAAGASPLALRGKTGSDDSLELSSGVFHSHDDGGDVCDESETVHDGNGGGHGAGGDDACGEGEGAGQGGEGGRGGRCSNRTVSSSSAGTFTESSSGHDGGAGHASLSVQNGAGQF